MIGESPTAMKDSVLSQRLTILSSANESALDLHQGLSEKKPLNYLSGFYNVYTKLPITQ